MVNRNICLEEVAVTQSGARIHPNLPTVGDGLLQFLVRANTSRLDQFFCIIVICVYIIYRLYIYISSVFISFSDRMGFNTIGRVALCITTFLALTTQYAGLKSSLPPIAYISVCILHKGIFNLEQSHIISCIILVSF